MPDDFREMLEELRDMVGNKKNPKDIIKTVPATKEWKKMYKETNDLGEQAKKMFGKMKASRAFFWATIERELDDYRQMHYNPATEEVEIYADEFDNLKKQGKSVKSPIQIKLED